MDSLEGSVFFNEDDLDNYLEHIGIKRRSGRYPWGSGEDPYQRSVGFKSYYEDLKKQGLSDSDIANGVQDHINAGRKEGDPFYSFKTTDLRAAIGISTDEIRSANVAMAKSLAAKQMSNGAIAERMGLPKSAESTVRGWLKDSDQIKENSIRATAELLKGHLKDKPFLDVGKGNEHYMGISATKLNTALAALRDEGYQLHAIKLPQLGTGKNTEYKILTKEGVTWQDARLAVIEGRIRNVNDHSDDGGITYYSPKGPPVSLASSRLQVRYKEDGGNKMDGIIELRRGVDDISLQGNNYAQVRVAVDKSHYLKGMAMYADDLPAGVDVRFNTNKSKVDAPGKLDALKAMKTTKVNGKEVIDTENPFGATTRPRNYTDAKGKEKRSPLEIVNEEGQWDDWGRALSSQMLSKQSITLANTQLNKAETARKKDLDEIMSLTNPVVKKKLLDEFADSADSAAVHLKAAAIDRQTTAVLLPMNSVRPGEIYAPNHDHGETLVLVRHPHGGPFEIPSLVNNLNNKMARSIMGAAKDAVGIHHTVAEQLSGADFDGDTVLVIPNNNRAVKTRPPLKGLEGFNPQERYKIPKDDDHTVRMTKKNTQTEMGKISNLITDMSIHKASDDELARAIRHSMVVIDAEKHGLDYKQSAKDNNIAELKERYQGGKNAGSATLISRSSSVERVPERKEITGARGVDPKTGEKLYELTGNTTTKTTTTKAGTRIEEVPRTTKGTKMEFAKDARELLSSKTNPQPMEEVYARHANAMKALANEARRAGHPENLKMPRQSKAARNLYADEVASLEAKLKIAQRNAPLERKAQAIATANAKARIDANPSYDKDDIKKVKYQELERARLVTGASKIKIGSDDKEHALTAREWEAIQAGAVSSTRLREILSNANMDRVRELATPRSHSSLTPGQIARARALVNSGRPTSEVAALLGIPRTTLADNLASE